MAKDEQHSAGGGEPTASPALHRAVVSALALLSGALVWSLILLTPGVDSSPEVHAESPKELPVGIRCLLEAYPDHLCSATPNAVIWCDGTVMPWDDGLAVADHEAWLEGRDLADQMGQRYPTGRSAPEPARHFDPGRARYEPFFRKMYGDSAKEVSRTLKPVRWMPGSVNRRILVTGVNGVDEKLAAVSAEIERLPAPIREKVAKTSGTFVWRTVKGTERLSAHSFAMAIDVGVEHSDYWRWSRPRGGGELVYRNRIPLEVVEVFERHGFIWGGRWYHYDTMHFEYRPELLVEGCVVKHP